MYMQNVQHNYIYNNNYNNNNYYINSVTIWHVIRAKTKKDYIAYIYF